MKNDPALMKIPIIMLTSTDNQSEINRAYELGANGYVVKPVGMESFIDRVVKLGMFIEVIELPEPCEQTGNGSAHARHPAC
jgi:DNA-binding NarL/FixJ family response regulator